MIARVGRGGGGVGVEESLFVGIVESVVPGWSSFTCSKPSECQKSRRGLEGALRFNFFTSSLSNS